MSPSAVSIDRYSRKRIERQSGLGRLPDGGVVADPDERALGVLRRHRNPAYGTAAARAPGRERKPARGAARGTAVPLLQPFELSSSRVLSLLRRELSSEVINENGDKV